MEDRGWNPACGPVKTSGTGVLARVFIRPARMRARADPAGTAGPLEGFGPRAGRALSPKTDSSIQTARLSVQTPWPSVDGHGDVADLQHAGTGRKLQHLMEGAGEQVLVLAPELAVLKSSAPTASMTKCTIWSGATQSRKSGGMSSGVAWLLLTKRAAMPSIRTAHADSLSRLS